MINWLKKGFLKFNKKDVETLGTLCKCGHLMTYHMRNPRGEGRERESVLGTCSECRRLNKECKEQMSR